MIQTLQRISLYIFLFSLNFEVWDPFETEGYFSISRLTGIIYFVVSIPAIINYKTSEKFKPIFNTIIVFFCYLIFVNAIHAESTKDSILDFTIFQNIVLFWILINHVRTEPLVLEKGLVFFSLGAATLALLYYLGIGIEITNDGRVSIFGDNQNAIGQRMCFAITIVTLAILQNRVNINKSRFLLLLIIPVLLGLLVATGSRLSILSLAIVFIAGLVLFKTKSHLAKGVIFLIGIVCFIFMVQLALENEMLRERFLSSIQEGNLSDRDVIWEHIFPLIKQNTIFGVGQTGYTNFCFDIFGRYMSPHNVILEIVCFTGVIGLFIYFIFLYQIFTQAYILYKAEGFLLPLLLSITVMGILLGSHILEVKIGWVILAYIATSYESAYQRIKEDSKIEADENNQVYSV